MGVKERWQVRVRKSRLLTIRRRYARCWITASSQMPPAETPREQYGRPVWRGGRPWHAGVRGAKPCGGCEGGGDVATVAPRGNSTQEDTLMKRKSGSTRKRMHWVHLCSCKQECQQAQTTS